MTDDATTCPGQYIASIFKLMHCMGKRTDWLLSMLREIDFKINRLPPEKQYQLLGVAQGLGMVPAPQDIEKTDAKR